MVEQESKSLKEQLQEQPQQQQLMPKQTEKEQQKTKEIPLFDIIRSPDFTMYLCILYLQKYADNIGIYYFLCQRAMKFPIGELRFFVPQFLQVLITVETESMALEEMVQDLCERDVHFSLLTFWHLQATLQELSKMPDSVGFQTCKRLLNSLQSQLFNISSHSATSISSTGTIKRSTGLNREFRENIQPSIILATSIAAGIGLPSATAYADPIVRVQGKQIKSFVFEVVKDIKKSLTENLTKKNTINNSLIGGFTRNSDEYDIQKRSRLLRNNEKTVRSVSTSNRRSEDLDFSVLDSYADINFPSLTNPSLRLKNKNASLSKSSSSIFTHAKDSNQQENLVSSMPNLHLGHSPSSSSVHELSQDDESMYSSSRESRDYRELSDVDSDYADVSNPGSPKINGSFNKKLIRSALSYPEKVKLLKTNYFKLETQFVMSLQNISIRLSKVPKEARLSTLKAELSLLNSDLPCEIDIPTLLPKNKRNKLHKVVRIVVKESAVLNSAERVPYLLLIEYLSDDFDFDPLNKSNNKLMNKLEGLNNGNADGNAFNRSRKYRFDLAYTNASTAGNSSSTSLNNSDMDGSTIGGNYDHDNGHDNFDSPKADESDLGDVSVVNLTNKLEKESMIRNIWKKSRNTSSGSYTSQLSGSSIDMNSAEENVRNIELSFSSRFNNKGDDDSDLATQMRIAAVMLQQLDSPNSTTPSAQAVQIKSRIIESMKSMQNGFGVTNLNEFSVEAGERKLSNDLKVAGISYLGEDWNTKKERIRNESKYGHLENWDLCSVIAKTGDDLTQEAFASQLIQAMANIWYQDKVKVWVKRMRILVTSSNTGLVETITNAVSVHSIKKSLSEYMEKNNEKPRGEVVSLEDHFVKMFGEPGSEKYKMAQEKFCSSLAAYSVICYVLQIKDRHNGNIMLDNEGHIIHIDFGFLLSNSPGSVGFEAAPFKLTNEYVNLLDGINGYMFQRFKQLTKDAFKSLRKHSESLINMVELMQKDSQLPCFKAGENTSLFMKQRLQLQMNDEEIDNFIENSLINKSIGSYYTRLYDQFQLLTQGIYI